MPMKNPMHPGKIVKQGCIDELGLTVTEAAEILGVSRSTLSRLINMQSGVSPEMAIRLEKAFGSTADTWIRLQAAYDMAEARKKADSIHVNRYVPKEEHRPSL